MRAAGAVAVSRIARAATVEAPVRPTLSPMQTISVVVPARDEAERIAPLLDAVVGAPGVAEVIVVDDQSTDATAEIARRAGTTVITGAPLPEGWAGKAWALQQGIAAASVDWVVTLDADARPDPRLPHGDRRAGGCRPPRPADRRRPIRVPDAPAAGGCIRRC